MEISKVNGGSGAPSLGGGVYLFSSFTGIPDSYFSGYAFFESDFVSGSKAAVAYVNETGRAILPEEDGCYISVARSGDGYLIGSDYSGNKKIFYYHDGVVWGISNSLIDLAKHLKANGIHVSHNAAQLQSFNIMSVITDQISCFTTMFRGIRLLPSRFNIKIDSKGFSLVRRRGRRDASDYKAALAQVVNLWLSRFETILSDPRVTVSYDLTGGKDSRLVFAFLKRASLRVGLVEADLVSKSHKTAKWAKDFAVASNLSKIYGVELNNKRRSPPCDSSVTLSGLSVFESWKSLNAGVYFPLYLRPYVDDPFNVHLDGAGGGNHKPFYMWKSPENFISDVATPSGVSSHDMAAWGDEFISTFMFLSSQNLDVDPWVLHYREFRGRMHGGRAPQFRTIVSPLASRGMEILSNFEGKAAASQPHFDVMESVLPGIILHPYDDQKKGPTAKNLEDLTIAPVEDKSSRGKVYISSDAIGFEDSRSEHRTPFDLLGDALHEGITDEVRDIMPNVVKRAISAYDLARKNEAFGHAVDAREITRVISASEVFRL